MFCDLSWLQTFLSSVDSQPPARPVDSTLTRRVTHALREKASTAHVAVLVCLWGRFQYGSGGRREWVVNLLDGKTLKGWTQNGGKAKYTVEEGQIVGTTVPATPNSFLCTSRDYSDFILELEFKVASEMNSGVQVRSHVYSKDAEVVINGKTKKKKAGTVFGYQVEIDPSERAWTGGIYDEARRGWLNDLKGNEAARKAFKQGEWNAFRIRCKGESIKTWLNGVPAADLKDQADASGFIGLQVHGVGKHPERVGKQVRWRNVRIKELK